MTVTIILLSVGLLLVAYIAWIQYSKTLKLEDIANSLANQLDTIGKIIQASKKTLDNPNLIQAFSNDDEVGVFFTQLKEIQNQLNEFTPPEDEKDE